jgi:hypothetical protein
MKAFFLFLVILFAAIHSIENKTEKEKLRITYLKKVKNCKTKTKTGQSISM